MRRKIYPEAFNSGGFARVLGRPLRGKMQCSNRVLVVILFLLSYLVFTLFLAGIEHNCPGLEELVLQDENKPFAHAIQRMARAANQTSFDPVVSDQLEKLGIKFPLPEPPVDDANSHNDLPTPPPTQFTNELVEPNELLKQGYAPHNVFYVWCGRRWFEFPHYLSVMSVIREMRPDNIIFFYESHPVVDSWTYNTWFEEIRQDYPFLRLWPLDENDKKEACDASAKVKPKFVQALLSYRGGTYVHESTIISKFPIWYRNQSLVDGLDRTTGHGFMMAQKGLPGRNVPVDDILSQEKYHTQTVKCSTINQYVQAYRKPMCVNTDEAFFPKDIWDVDNSFGRLARRILYGDPKVKRPEKSYDELIPNIAHIVWLGGGEMDFLFYLCVLSLVYVAEVDMVYIHGDAPPSGMYWNRIKDDNKVTLIYRDTPSTIYGNKVEIISHVTDVWRVDFMVKYGGIYVDTDTVFVKPLDREIRAYDAVGSYDWTYWNPPFPDTINFGVAIGKRNAKFWREFQKSMKWFMDKDWSWNGLRQPYRIQERHPDMVLIDPHLQVICFEAKCHPTWWPNYHDESVHHLNTNSITNWRNDTYAFHWTLPTPDELLNEENLVKSDSIFAEIGQYILKKAGKLKM